MNRLHIEIAGIVQGVGFRPFLHRLARREHLAGWARNTPAGVELELEGDAPALDRFVHTVGRAATSCGGGRCACSANACAGRLPGVCHPAQQVGRSGHARFARPCALPGLPA